MAGHNRPELDWSCDGHVPSLLPLQSRSNRAAGTSHQRALTGQFGIQDGGFCLAFLFPICRLACHGDQYPWGIPFNYAYILRNNGDFNIGVLA
jgi:hypothetical protein